jgi:hypothetical protein
MSQPSWSDLGVRKASELAAPETGLRTDEALPLRPELRALFPGQALRRGTTVAIAPGRARVTTALALASAASAAGSWVAFAGLPHLGVVSVEEWGIDLERVCLVPYPRTVWAEVLSILIDGMDLVIFQPADQLTPGDRARISARLRARGSVLIALPQPGDPWEGAETALTIDHTVWHGLGRGTGRLKGREVTVTSRPRSTRDQPRRITYHHPDDWHPPVRPQPGLISVDSPAPGRTRQRSF